MNKVLQGAAVACAIAFASHGASATPLSGTFGVTVYQGTGSGSSSDPTQQANLANPLFATAPVATFTYTGALDFNSTDASNNTISAFFASGGGTTSTALPNTPLSNSGFGLVTLISITGTTGLNLFGTVEHDDGASLYQGTTTIFDSSPPTVEIASDYALPAGSFQLVYVEANGAPAALTFDVQSSTNVPEPASMAVLGLGLVGLGLARRRRA